MKTCDITRGDNQKVKGIRRIIDYMLHSCLLRNFVV